MFECAVYTPDLQPVVANAFHTFSAYNQQATAEQQIVEHNSV
jgi:hypothetical protein